LLGFCIHIFLTGLEAAAQDEWNAYVITHSITRALFMLVYLPAGYAVGWLGPDPQIFADFPPLLFALYIAAFIPIFRSIRRSNENESPLRDVLLTLGCVAALGVYYVIIGMLHSIIVDIYYLAVFMPLLLIFLILIAFGKTVPLTPGEINAKNRDAAQRAEHEKFLYYQRKREEEKNKPPYQGL
jgi:hypothetical protein